MARSRFTAVRSGLREGVFRAAPRSRPGPSRCWAACSVCPNWARVDRGHLAAGRAKSVVLIYLQGGPPTQDMFDMKPERPGGVGGEFKPIATSASGVEICELLPRTARWMHKSAIVRSVYHNGGCHKNLPMYTGYDVNLPDEEFRDSDPPSMGSVCAYLERDRQQELPTYAYLPCPLGLGRGAQKGRPARRVSGRRYDPFSHRVHRLRRPSARRDLEAASRARRAALDRHRAARRDHARSAASDRRRLVEQFDEEFRSLEAQRDLGNFPRQQRLAYEMLTSAKVREAFDLGQEDARRATATAARCLARRRCWPGGWSSAACNSST